MSDTLRVIESAETLKTETSQDPWAQWQEKNARHDAQVRRRARHIARIAAAAFGIGAIVYWSFFA